MRHECSNDSPAEPLATQRFIQTEAITPQRAQTLNRTDLKTD